MSGGQGGQPGRETPPLLHVKHPSCVEEPIGFSCDLEGLVEGGGGEGGRSLNRFDAWRRAGAGGGAVKQPGCCFKSRWNFKHSCGETAVFLFSSTSTNEQFDVPHLCLGAVF